MDEETEAPPKGRLPNARICPSCRRYFDVDYTGEDYRFCPYCGAKLVRGTVSLRGINL